MSLSQFLDQYLSVSITSLPWFPPSFGQPLFNLGNTECHSFVLQTFVTTRPVLDTRGYSKRHTAHPEKSQSSRGRQTCPQAVTTQHSNYLSEEAPGDARQAEGSEKAPKRQELRADAYGIICVRAKVAAKSSLLGENISRWLGGRVSMAL